MPDHDQTQRDFIRARPRRSLRSSDARFFRRRRRVFGSLTDRRSATPVWKQVDIVRSGRHIHDMRRIVVSVLAMALVFAGLAAGPAESASLPKRGDHSATVLKLERALHKNHVLKKKHVNRTFGKATTKALRKYQKAQRLRITGKANGQTWNRLFTSKLREDASLPERGDRSAEVLKLERALHKKHALKKKHVNRTFKEATTKALRKYQKRERLRVTGKVNAETWKRLFPAKPKPKPKPAPPPKPKPPTAKHLVLVEGHSGAPINEPENTMASFRAAAAAKADYLGTDVRWTSDGVMYLFHDSDLAPKTDCSGPVRAKTWDEIKECRIGGEPLATFDEYLEFASEQGLGISPELKQPDLTVEQAVAYTTAIRRHGLVEQSVASSFDAAALARLRSVAPEMVTGLITFRTPVSAAAARAAGKVYLPWKDSMTTAKVAEYHRAGLTVWTWTARSEADFQQCYDLLADSVITDDPAGLRLWLKDDV
jgi:glycerophosphoryl diester phosphodiesterase